MAAKNVTVDALYHVMQSVEVSRSGADGRFSFSIASGNLVMHDGSPGVFGTRSTLHVPASQAQLAGPVSCY